MRREDPRPPEGFGRWLSAQMLRCGYKSNVELESVTGIGDTTISRWRNGVMAPSVDQLRKLEGPLRTPLLELLVRAGVISQDEAKIPRELVSDTSPASVSVPEAIKQDANLIDEAREHLLNQYELLLRVTSPVPDPRKRKASQASLGRLRADVRNEGQQRPVKERERGTGTQGDG